MNYRHAFHAGNHADVLKHVALLALCDALTGKPSACFALDTHAGRGLYALGADQAMRTGEATGGIARLHDAGDGVLARYLDAVAACRSAHGADAYPGSPWLLAHALRAQDRIACCEWQEDEARALRALFADDARVAVHGRDGYAAMHALLPPRVDGVRFARGLVLVDPPYETQLAEFDTALAALEDAMARWPQGVFVLWYPIKRRRDLAAFYRRAAELPAKSVLLCELLVRADDSPLRLNGSGLLVLNPPWRIEERLAPALQSLAMQLDAGGGAARIEYLKSPD